MISILGANGNNGGAILSLMHMAEGSWRVPKGRGSFHSEGLSCWVFCCHEETESLRYPTKGEIS
jgi:hypothetical protein